MLSTENKRRDRESLDDTYDNVYLERMGEDGVMEKVKVDKVLLDFLYCVPQLIMYISGIP